MPYNDYIMPAHSGPLHFEVPSNYEGTLRISPRVMIPSGPNQTAIEIYWPDIDSCFMTSVVIDTVHFRPIGYPWFDFIKLHNGWNASIVNCAGFGPGGVANPATNNGIVLTGKSCDVSIINFKVHGVTTGILGVDRCEGVDIQGYKAVGVINGLVLQTPELCCGLTMNNFHINASANAILMQKRVQFQISNGLIYGADLYDSTRGVAFNGILGYGCHDGDVERVQVGVPDPNKLFGAAQYFDGERIRTQIETLPFPSNIQKRRLDIWRDS